MLTRDSKSIINMESLALIKTRLCLEDAFDVLHEFDCMFSPCLSTIVDIAEYARKLAQNAFWILCKKSEQLVGYIAFYRNIETGVDYITSICVLDVFKHYNVATKMLDYLTIDAPSAITAIKLECRKNNPAVLFYLKRGFEIQEEGTEKYMMIKRINRNTTVI